jgi:hypothetical protein
MTAQGGGTERVLCPKGRGANVRRSTDRENVSMMDRTRQRLHHPFCRPIGLRPIGHRSLLFLSHDSAECVEEIRHEAGFTVVPDGFTGSKTSEDTLFIILRDRLGCSRRARFRDHVSREQIDPQEQLGVAFEGLRQRRDVVHGHDLERVRSLYVPWRFSLPDQPSLPCLPVCAFSHIALDTPVQPSPMEVRSDPLVRPADSLVAPFQAGVIMMQEILLQGLGHYQSRERVSFLTLPRGGGAIEEQICFIHFVVVGDLRAGLRFIRCQPARVSQEVRLQTDDPCFLVLGLSDAIDPHTLYQCFL